MPSRTTLDRSRKSGSVSRTSPNPHMLTGLLRSHRRGTKQWSQRQGQMARLTTWCPEKAQTDTAFMSANHLSVAGLRTTSTRSSTGSTCGPTGLTG